MVKVSNLSSISGGKDKGGGGIECHACGQKGHKRNECPDRKRRRELQY